MGDFETFYRDHLRLVHALALARAAEPAQAEDLTQETFFRAWRHSARLSRMAPLAQRGWLARTVANLAIDRWRRDRSVPLADVPERVAEPCDRDVLRLDVARALATLSEEERQVVVLRYFLEMTSGEIGEALGLPEGTIRSRLHYARRLLAGRLSAWSE